MINQYILEHLQAAQTVAVVGLSDKPHRASYQVAQFLQSKGKKIIPINPLAMGMVILGEKVFASLTDAAKVYAIDMVDVFRASEEVMPIAQEAIAVGAKLLWMQFGVINDAAAQAAKTAGILVVMDRCPKIEWR